MTLIDLLMGKIKGQSPEQMRPNSIFGLRDEYQKMVMNPPPGMTDIPPFEVWLKLRQQQPQQPPSQIPKAAPGYNMFFR